MRLLVLAVGRLKERHWREAAGEYVKRLGRYAKVDTIELADRDLGEGGAERAKRLEGEALLKALPEGSRIVALDAGGTQFTSEGLAGWLEEHMVRGTSHVTFVMGGSAGLDDAVLARADERLSLGKMTLPHQLARVVLLEQVYRAFRIIRNEPYHL
jgi:23S rRNA (pseudouridine1915-N3)-methyltransferase